MNGILNPIRTRATWPLTLAFGAWITIALLAGDVSFANQAAGASGAANEVHVGIYVNQIHRVSLKDNLFVVDFYVWFRWKGDDLKPLGSFEVVNGQINSKSDETTKDIEGEHYGFCRVVSTITQFWDISHFPYDNHVLGIMIEDGENVESVIHYVADAENCGISPDVQVPGWSLGKFDLESVSHKYSTNYGDTSLPTGSESVYSRFQMSIPILRTGYGYFMKLFLSLFVATAIAFLAFCIKPTEVDPRFGLGIGALFAAVASEYVVTGALPDTSILTMADKLHVVSFAFIFISIAESTYSLKLYASEVDSQVALSKKLDHLSIVFLSIAYIACIIFITTT